MKFKLPKNLFKIFITNILVITSIVTPAIIFGIKSQKEDKTENIPFELFTPLPASWYLSGDIEEFNRAIFTEAIKKYEDNHLLLSAEMNVAFAKLNIGNLMSIKESYEGYILDIPFEADYNVDVNKTKIYMPEQLNYQNKLKEGETIKDYINWSGKDVFSVLNKLEEEKIPGFSFKLLNELYWRVHQFNKDPSKYGWKSATNTGTNSFLYMIDKNLDKSKNGHNYYRLKVWPSTKNNLSTHSDNKSLESIEETLKHAYNMVPTAGVSATLSWELGHVGENTLGASNFEDDFCYSDDELTKPSSLSMNQDVFENALRYLCAPIGDPSQTSLTIHDTNYDGVFAAEAQQYMADPYDISSQPKLKNYHFTVKHPKFLEIQKVYEELRQPSHANEIWFDNTIPSNTNTIVLKIKPKLFEKLNLLAYNKRNYDKDKPYPDSQREWDFVWNQLIGKDHKLIGWWYIFDKTGNDNKKSFKGKYYQKIVDNNKQPETIIVCDQYNILDYRLPTGGSNADDPDIGNLRHTNCEKTTSITDNLYSKIYQPNSITNSIDQHIYVKNDEYSLGRKYETFADGDNNKAIRTYIKELQKISNSVLNHSTFNLISSLAVDKLGGSFLDLLRAVGSFSSSDNPNSYWNFSVDLLKDYIANDSTIYWKSFIPQGNVMKGLALKDIKNKLKNLPFSDFLYFFGVNPTDPSDIWTTNKKIKDLLIDGFAAYNGFHSHPYTMANFSGVTTTNAPLGNQDSNLILWREIGSQQFESVNAAIIAFVIKYASIIVYNSRIYEDQILKANSSNIGEIEKERRTNLENMLHATFPLPTVVTPGYYYHNKEAVNNRDQVKAFDNGPMLFNDLQTELDMSQFKPYFEDIF